MIYAKCIHSSQLANTVEEFRTRQGEENAVYCIGETTDAPHKRCPAKYELCAVPLRLIFDCCKYGDLIAVLDVPELEVDIDDGSGNVNNRTILMDEQKIIRVFKVNSKEAIDFVFDNAAPNVVHDGYVRTHLSESLQEYFYNKKTDFDWSSYAKTQSH